MPKKILIEGLFEEKGPVLRERDSYLINLKPQGRNYLLVDKDQAEE